VIFLHHIPFEIIPLKPGFHSNARNASACVACVKNRIGSVVAFSCTMTACVLLFFACVILLRLLCTFYFACVLFLTQGLACVWMETGLSSCSIIIYYTSSLHMPWIWERKQEQDLASDNWWKRERFFCRPSEVVIGKLYSDYLCKPDLSVISCKHARKWKQNCSQVQFDTSKQSQFISINRQTVKIILRIKAQLKPLTVHQETYSTKYTDTYMLV